MLLAGGLLVAGCGEPERPVIQSEEADSYSTKGKLKKILDRRAKALLDKDEAAYLADLDPSNTDLVRREKMLFANLRQFDFAEIRYILNSAMENTVDGNPVFRPVIRVAKLSADAGPGDVAPAEAFLYQLTKQGDRFLVGDIVAATRQNREELVIDGPPADAPWHTDELRVVTVSGKVWLAGDRTVKDLDEYAAVTDRELRQVQKLWGDRTSFPGYVLFFTRSFDTLKRWFGLGNGRFGTRALGYQIPLWGVKKDGEFLNDQYTGSRIVVNLGSIEAHASSPALTIRHELAHAATTRAMKTGGRGIAAPTWAVEGFARYTETIDDTARAAAVRDVVVAGARAGMFAGRTPKDEGFYDKDAHFNYCLGATVFSVAERLKGRDAAVELYARVIEHTDSADHSFFEIPVFDRISRDVLGISGGSFSGRWHSFVRNGG